MTSLRRSLTTAALLAGLGLSLPLGLAQATSLAPHVTRTAVTAKVTPSARPTPKAKKAPKPKPTPSPSPTSSPSPTATASPTPTPSTTPAPSSTPSTTPAPSSTPTPSGTPSAGALTAQQALIAQIITDHLAPEAVVTGTKPLTGTDAGVELDADYQDLNPTRITVSLSSRTAQQNFADRLACASNDMFCGSQALSGGRILGTGYPELHGGTWSFQRQDGRVVTVDQYNDRPDTLLHPWWALTDRAALFGDPRWEQVLAELPVSPHPAAAQVTPASPLLDADQVRQLAEQVLRSHLPAGATVTATTPQAWGTELSLTWPTSNGTATGSLAVSYGQATWDSLQPEKRCSRWTPCGPVDLGDGLAWSSVDQMYGTLESVHLRGDGGAVAVTATPASGEVPLTADQLNVLLRDPRWAQVVSSTPATQPAG